MDYTDQLRLLALNDAAYVERVAADGRAAAEQLDRRGLALARLGALIATGGSVPSYGAETDSAFEAGVTAAEIVGALLGVASIVGMPRVVTAAPSLALALGYDTADALEDLDGVSSRPSAAE